MVQILIYPFVYLVWDSQTLNIQRFSENFLIYNFEVFHVSLKDRPSLLRFLRATDTFARSYFFSFYTLIFCFRSVKIDVSIFAQNPFIRHSCSQANLLRLKKGRIDSFRRLSLVLQNQNDEKISFTKLTSPNLSELKSKTWVHCGFVT